MKSTKVLESTLPHQDTHILMHSSYIKTIMLLGIFCLLLLSSYIVYRLSSMHVLLPLRKLVEPFDVFTVKESQRIFNLDRIIRCTSELKHNECWTFNES
jgi:hypothetical protein